MTVYAITDTKKGRTLTGIAPTYLQTTPPFKLYNLPNSKEQNIFSYRKY